MTHIAIRRRIRRLACSALAAIAAAGAVPAPGAQAETEVSDGRPISDEGRRIEVPGFREVGRVAVPVFDPKASPNEADQSGWLILNPVSRRGYVIGDVTDSSQTTVRSFDLDTLQPRGQVTLPGKPVLAGRGTTASGTQPAGEVVHAVDPVAGRIYIAMSQYLVSGLIPVGGPDAKRLFNYVLVLDEEKFDRNPAQGFGSFSLAPLQQHLAADHLVGMNITRKGVAPGQPGKLLGLFAFAYQFGAVPAGSGSIPLPVKYKHTLVQWSPGALPTGSAPPTIGGFLPGGALPLPADWEAPLLACANSTLASDGRGHLSSMMGNYQWGLLVTDEAVFTGCQTSPNAGAVVRIALDANGRPAAEPQQIVSYAQTLSDVVVDDVRKRLFLRSFSNDGTTWWLFDTVTMRYQGSIATAVSYTEAATGIDPATGRLYTLRPDRCALRAGGGYVPIEGGLLMTDTAELPLGAPQLLVPELSRTAVWRIVTDPVTRRVYVRRGLDVAKFEWQYPSCRGEDREIVKPERFYRVYENSIPLAPLRPAFDDSQFTSHVREEPGRTQASFLGTGSGYGARQMLVGGTDALTDGAATRARSLCGTDTREVLAGAVDKVELSDQSTVGEAAALDADGATQQVAGDPVSRCRPQAPPTAIAGRNTDELNDCHGNLDVREASFDQATDEDANNDGCNDRDGRNRYAAACLDDDAATSPGFDDGTTNHAAPRDGFHAKVTCDGSNDKASGSATAATSSNGADTAWKNTNQGAGSIRVAHASSHVEVTRAANKGVTVKVDSIARGVEIPGVGLLGVVRAEATSTATGRHGTARTSFKRTVCDVRVPGLVVPGCLGEDALQGLVAKMNEALSGRGQVRLRNPDPKLGAGSPHGYLAAIQRDRLDGFEDQMITRDTSLAVPALEIMTFFGDGGAWGAGRQIVHLAGVQATTTYGIACTWGRAPDGTCVAEGDPGAGVFADVPSGPDGGPGTNVELMAGGGSASGESMSGAAASRENVVTRLLRAIPRAVAEALRLLFNNPRELGLLAALWALLYAPCYLGDRRRAVRAIAGRRLGTA